MDAIYAPICDIIAHVTGRASPIESIKNLFVCSSLHVVSLRIKMFDGRFQDHHKLVLDESTIALLA